MIYSNNWLSSSEIKENLISKISEKLLTHNESNKKLNKYINKLSIKKFDSKDINKKMKELNFSTKELEFLIKNFSNKFDNLNSTLFYDPNGKIPFPKETYF